MYKTKNFQTRLSEKLLCVLQCENFTYSKVQVVSHCVTKALMITVKLYICVCMWVSEEYYAWMSSLIFYFIYKTFQFYFPCCNNKDCYYSHSTIHHSSPQFYIHCARNSIFTWLKIRSIIKSPSTSKEKKKKERCNFHTWMRCAKF